MIIFKIKVILYLNFCNLIGKVYIEEEVKLLVNLVVENDLFVIVDELYREFIYDDNDKYYFLLDIEKVKENVIIIDSVFKYYSVCGVRVGFLILKNKDFMIYIMKFC